MRRLFLAALLVLVAGCAPPGAPPGAAQPTGGARATTAAAPTSAAAPTADDEDAITFEATGSGPAITIDYGPTAGGSNERLEKPALPFTKSVPDSGADIYQIVIVGGENVGCRITVGGKVVEEQPVGGSAHCIYRP